MIISFKKELGRQKKLIEKRQGIDMFKADFIQKAAYLISGIDNMPVTLIVKPYKKFIAATVKLCALFSFLIFLSFTPLITFILFACYIVLIYFTNIFINLCAKFGYKKFMLFIIFAVLYFLCFIATTNLRHFIAAFIF